MVVQVSCLGDWPETGLTYGARVAVPDGPVRIGVRVDGRTQQFSVNGAPFGGVLDAALISDEGGGASMPALPAPSWACWRMT